MAPTRLALVGEIDMAVEEELQERLLNLALDAANAVIVDLSQCTFFGSTGISVIAELLDRGLNVSIEGASTAAKRVLAIAGLKDLISLE